MGKPLVSICCLSFNQAKFIRKCLDGFLLQETTFPVEILIHDDCSTDGTAEIIQEYATKYPDKVFPIFETENKYCHGWKGKMELFNVEFRLCKDGKLYLMEVSPRAGGNRLAEMLNYAADVNIVEAEVRRAMGLPIEEIHEPNYNGHHAIVVLHANISGFFQEVCVDKSFAHGHLLEKEVRVKKNQEISSFSGANAALGTLFLRFDTRQELDEAMENKDKWLNVKIAAK